MTTLQDTLVQAVQKGFYQDIKGAVEGYIKFTAFGSLGCKAVAFDSDGKQIRGEEVLLTDGIPERIRYQLIPTAALPPALRAKESPLEQRPASCTIKETRKQEASEPSFPHPPRDSLGAYDRWAAGLSP